MTEMVKVTVRLPREVHAAVRTRAFREGRTLDELGRGFFEAYGGLAAGEQPGRTESATPKTDSRVASEGLRQPSGEPEAQVPAPAASPSFKPDPKVKK